jgi:sugar-specific transcriptional regulator TrmB
MNTLEGLLHEIGLSEYEAKTLICLMTHGTSTADEISRMAKIPLPRVYDTIERLIEMGFVLSAKTRPKQYKPVESGTALKNYIEHRKREFDGRMSNIRYVCEKVADEFSNLIPESKTPRREKWRIWTIRNENNIFSMRREAEKHARKEILMLSSGAMFLKEDMDILRKLAKKGVRMRLLLDRPENAEISRNVKTLSKLGAEVKTGYAGSMRGNIIDDRQVTMILKWGKPSPDGAPGSGSKFSYEMLLINNPFFVSVMREYFNLIWERL